MTTCQGGCHQVCSFLWVDSYLILSHSETHLEQMMIFGRKWDLELKSASLLWTNINADENMEDDDKLFEKGFKILEYTFSPNGRNAERILYEGSEGGRQDFLEEDGDAISVGDDCRKSVESHEVDMRQEATCGNWRD